MNVDEEKVLKKIQNVLLKMLHEFQRVCGKYDIQYFVAYGTLLGAVRHKGFIPWDNDMDVWMTRDNYRELCRHKDEFGDEFELIQPESLAPDKFYCPTPELTYKYAYFRENEELISFYGEKVARLHIDLFLIDRTYSGMRGKIQRYRLCLLYGLMGAYRCKAYDPGVWSPFIRFAQAILNPVGRLIPLDRLWGRVEKIAGKFDNKADTDIYFETANTFESVMRDLPRTAFDGSSVLDFEDTKVLAPQDYDTVLRMRYDDYMELPPEDERVPHWGFFLNLEKSAIKVSDTFVLVEEPKGETEKDCVDYRQGG